jgi:hypothetical protein
MRAETAPLRRWKPRLIRRGEDRGRFREIRPTKRQARTGCVLKPSRSKSAVGRKAGRGKSLRTGVVGGRECCTRAAAISIYCRMQMQSPCLRWGAILSSAAAMASLHPLAAWARYAGRCRTSQTKNQQRCYERGTAHQVRVRHGTS